MGFIKDDNVFVLEASLTFKGRKNFFNILDPNINKIAYFTLSDTDVNYDIASQTSNLTQLQNIPANGFIPDFTGDYVLCIKSTGKGVDESSITSFLGRTSIIPNVQYVWDQINVVCQTNQSFSSSVVNGNHNSGLSISKNILKTVNGVYQKAYNVSVPINLLGSDLHNWLINTQNTIEQISSDNINLLTSGRTLTNYSSCPLDVDFSLTADQISTVASNDTFITVLNISGGTGVYSLSIDNGLTYNTINGNQYQFNGLPENQLRNVIVKDSQINPYSTKKSITTPTNIVIPQSVMALVTEFSATPNFLPVQGGNTTLKIGISQAVTADTIFTLSNGQSITIFNGNTTNSVIYNVPNNSGSTQSSLTINITNISNPNISAPSNKNSVTIIIDTWVDFNPQQYVCEQTGGGNVPLNITDSKNTQRVLRKQHLNSDINQTRFVVDNTYPNPAVACPLPQVIPVINFSGIVNRTVNALTVDYDITVGSSVYANNSTVRIREDIHSSVDPNIIVGSSVLNYGLINGSATRHFTVNRQTSSYNIKYTILDNGGIYTIGQTNFINILNPSTPGAIQPGGTGGGGCLLAGQRILIDSNYNTKLIEDVKIGDYVYTKHEFKNEFGLYKVIDTLALNVDNYYSITTIDDKNIKCSASHLFMIDGMKQRADELTLDKQLMVLNNDNFNNVNIKSIDIINESTTVYKLEIEDAHTYITENLIYNHNKVISQQAIQ